jgi:cytidylate kinase
VAVVTISGQVGAGAREIGRLAAGLLGIDYVDQQMLVEAARQLGVPVESVVTHDERTAGLGERLAAMLRRFLERSAAAGAGDPTLGAGGLDVLLGRTYAEAAAGEGLPEISDEQYVKTLAAVIRDLATNDNVLIIGRGSQVILRDWPGATHVLLVAPLETRVRSLEERGSIDAERAAQAVNEAERGRCSFHQKLFKIDVNDPAHYHLTLNTALLSQQEAARLIAEAARRAPA